jgi:hypothetical protein
MAKERREWLAGVLVVLMRARGESGGLYPVLSTTAARWQPAGESERVARQGRLQREAMSGGGDRARRVGASTKQEVARRRPRAAVRRRQQKQRGRLEVEEKGPNCKTRITFNLGLK